MQQAWGLVFVRASRGVRREQNRQSSHLCYWRYPWLPRSIAKRAGVYLSRFAGQPTWKPAGDLSGRLYGSRARKPCGAWKPDCSKNSWSSDAISAWQPRQVCNFVSWKPIQHARAKLALVASRHGWRKNAGIICCAERNWSRC